jgi:hypothetical protein
MFLCINIQKRSHNVITTRCLSSYYFEDIIQMRAVKLVLPLAIHAVPSNGVTHQPDPGSVKATSSSNGNGCPPNTVSPKISNDGTLVTYIFDRYRVSIGPGQPAADKAANCALHTTVQSPAGFGFTISNVTWKGVATMDPGVSLTVSSSWYLEDASTAKSYYFAVVSGEKSREGMFENSTTVPAGERVWSRCAGTQTFTFSSRVKIESINKNASGYLDYEWETVSGLWVQLGLLWRECQE